MRTRGFSPFRTIIDSDHRAGRPECQHRVVMYADTITKSMEIAISETNRRRRLQMEYNAKHGITPQTIQKEVKDIVQAVRAAEDSPDYQVDLVPDKATLKEIASHIKDLEKQMFQAANELEFELAAQLRDRIKELRQEAGLTD